LTTNSQIYYCQPHIKKSPLRTTQSCKIVYFDLEISSFGKYAYNLQTAMKCETNPLLSIYINPWKFISPSSREVTALANIKEKLFVNEKRVADSID
jgi:hypothetical protein